MEETKGEMMSAALERYIKTWTTYNGEVRNDPMVRVTVPVCARYETREATIYAALVDKDGKADASGSPDRWYMDVPVAFRFKTGKKIHVESRYVHVRFDGTSAKVLHANFHNRNIMPVGFWSPERYGASEWSR